MKRTLSSFITAAFALLMGACTSVTDVGLGNNALHVAKCPQGIPCESTLKVGTVNSPVSNVSDTIKKGLPAKPVPWKDPDAGSAKAGVKLDPARNIHILRKQEPTAVPRPVKIDPATKGGPVARPAKPKSEAKPSEPPAPPKVDEGQKKAAAPSSGGPPPSDVIPPPKDIRPKG